MNKLYITLFACLIVMTGSFFSVNGSYVDALFEVYDWKQEPSAIHEGKKVLPIRGKGLLGNKLGAEYICPPACEYYKTGWTGGWTDDHKSESFTCYCNDVKR